MQIFKYKPYIALNEGKMGNVLRGTYVAIVTPMKRNGHGQDPKINYDVLPGYLDFLLRDKTDGIVVCGCTGADALLSEPEQIKFIDKCNKIVNHLRKKYDRPLLVIAGDGSNWTTEAIERAKRVEGETGVLTHLQISPYKVKPTQHGIFEHYSAVMDAIKGKMIMYSVNGRTGGQGILPETALRLASKYEGRMLAIKEASAGDGENVRRASKIMEGAKSMGLEFTVLSGDDDATLEMMNHGATGVISVAANVAPTLVSEMVRSKLLNLESAKMYNDRLSPLFKVLFTENNPQDVMHALNHIGYDVGIPRLPLTEPSMDAKLKIEEVVDAVLKRN